MTPRGQIAHGGPQRLPHARRSAKLAAVAARRARGPSVDSMDDPQPP